MSLLNNVIVEIVQNEQQLADAFFVRNEVFVKEQGVPSPLERDEYEDESKHFVAYFEKRPIAAGRVCLMNDTVAKVDRVCVLPAFRRKQIGILMMKKLEEYVKDSNVKVIKLNAQHHAVPFYEAQHYVITSPEFLDAGIPHRAMEKHFNTI